MKLKGFPELVWTLCNENLLYIVDFYFYSLLLPNLDLIFTLNIVHKIVLRTLDYRRGSGGLNWVYNYKPNLPISPNVMQMKIITKSHITRDNNKQNIILEITYSQKK